MTGPFVRTCISSTSVARFCGRVGSTPFPSMGAMLYSERCFENILTQIEGSEKRILCLSFSIISFLAILLVLYHYDQSKTPDLPRYLTLNTIVAILTTASRSSLLCMIGTSMGQLKWIWCRQQKRPLYDLQAFEDASRGPWGSMPILASRPHRGNLLLSLGAVITIAALTFGPFMQQIITFPTKQVPSRSYNATVKQAILPGTQVGEHLFVAMMAGMYSTAGPKLDPVCPSGNCTWLPFKSAGWCSKCEDVTSRATSIGCDMTSFNTSRHENQTVSCNSLFPDGSWANGDLRGHWNDIAQSLLVEVPLMQVINVNDQPHGGPYLN